MSEDKWAAFCRNAREAATLVTLSEDTAFGIGALTVWCLWCDESDAARGLAIARFTAAANPVDLRAGFDEVWQRWAASDD